MSETKAIRIWKGCKVVHVVVVNENSSSTKDNVGGAENSTFVDIEIDPWAGLIVDHSTKGPPVNFRKEEV